MKRLFSIAAVFSLLLWLLVFVGWIRSRSGIDQISFLASGRYFDISIGRAVNIIIARDWPDPVEARWLRSRYEDTGYVNFDVETSAPGPLVPPQTYTLAGFFVEMLPNTTTVMFHSQSPSPDDAAYMIVLQPSNQAGQRIIEIGFTSWLVPLALPAILPLCWIGLTYRNHRRRVYRLRNHLCLSCGYDLRASTDKCPECGTAIPVAAGNPNDQTRMTNQ